VASPGSATPLAPTLSPPAASDPADQEAITVTAHNKPPPEDPLQNINAASFAVLDVTDKAIVAPVAMAYKNVVPPPVRTGLRNFLANLQEPVTFLNFVIQIKPGKAAQTLGRFAINATVGAGGVIDVATKRPFNWPRRRNGFAFTLGFYGIKTGPFLYLPLIGSTTLRDVIGRVIDLSLVPALIGRPFNRPAYALPSAVIRALDDRVESDAKLREYKASATATPYAAERADYLQTRQADIDALRNHRWWMGKQKRPNATAPTPAVSPPGASDAQP
jgi:phospholipid-binding lipoprotein MlaA